MPGSGARAQASRLSARVGPLVVRSPKMISALLAAAALGLAAGGGPGWPAVAAWLAGFAAMALDVARARESDAAGFARQVPARVLLLAAAAVGATLHSPGQRGSIWSGSFVVLAAVVLEPILVTAWPRPEVVNLPGFRASPGAPLVPALAPAGMAVLALAGLFGVVAAPGPVRLLLPLAALVVAAAAAAIGLANARDRSARRTRLRAALEQYAPQYAVYTGRDDGGAYQVAMWLPYLEQLAVPYIVIARRPSALRALRATTDAPMVARGSWRDLDDVVVPGLRAAFYVNSVASNVNFVTYRQLTHVYLGHGDSDKPLSHHPAHAMYDQVFVAGRAAIERYARNHVAMRPDAFVVVGRPQLAALRVATARADPPTVLYAPTWAGYNQQSSHSSLPLGTDIVRALLARGAVVIFRPHPFSREQAGERDRAAAVDDVLSADAARTGRAHQWGPVVDRLGFIETANASDAMVADVSSVLVDYLAADKPMAVMMVGADTAEQFTARYPVAAGAYVVRPDPGDPGDRAPAPGDVPAGSLSQALGDMLGADPLRAARAATRDYYLGGLDGPGSVAAFVSAARAAVDHETP